ncbi:phage terminase small subunit P27 family [Symbiopectobacterium sp. Eva_TO]
MKRAPKAPDYLDEIAATEWKAKAKFMAERGDLNPADWNSLELYCVNYSIYRKAIADIAERGFSVEGSRGAESRNPSLAAKADAERIMIKMASLLGFDPVSRRRNPVEIEEEDDIEKLLNARKCMA